MGVDGTQIGVFGAHVLEDGDQYRVLEHVGMVACVVSVAITEHAPMVPAGVMALAMTLSTVAAGLSGSAPNAAKTGGAVAQMPLWAVGSGWGDRGAVGVLYNGGLSQRFVAPRRNIHSHLRGSRQKNADRGKGPAKPFLQGKPCPLSAQNPLM